MRAEPVISKVRQAVADEGGQGIASAELAQQYAELCAEANKRLANCATCLKQGMVSEALRVADTEPQLLDLCAELDFVGVEKWEKLCQEKKWPAPERLDAKAIQDINDAFCSSQIIEPLLKEYRRAVRTNETRECIRLLRRLAALDKSNSNWTEDLKGFERKRWGELRKEYENANKAENIDALASLLIEINGEWIASRDDKLRNEVRDACRLVYAKQALAKGRELVRAISAAYAAFNYDQLGESLRAYEGLLAEGHLAPDSPMQTQVDEAREWFLTEKKRRDEERLFEDTIAKLRDAVESGNPTDLEDILNVLTRFDRPIPDRLEERAKTLVEGYQLAQGRRRKRILVSGIAVSLLVMAGIVSYLAKIRYDKEVATVSADLEQRYGAEDLAAFAAAIDRVEKDQPKVFQNSEVQKWVRRKGELSARIDQKRTAFGSALSRLESIREDGFQEDSGNIEGLLAEAKANAAPGVDQGRLAIIVREWEAQKLETQARLDEKAMGSIAALEQQLARLVKAESSDPTAARRNLGILKSKATEMISGFGPVSDSVHVRATALDARIESMQRDIEGKERQLETIRKARSLSVYLEAMETYVRAFPQDKLSQTFARVVELGALYRQIDESPISSSPNNVFWAAEAKSRDERIARMREQWPDIQTQLRDLEKEKRYTDLWECETEWGTIYVEGKPASTYSQGVRTFEGLIYRPKPDDLHPEFKVESLRESSIHSRNLMAHCDFVKGLISLARFSAPERAVNDLMGKMSELAISNDIPSLLRVRLMDMLAGYVEGLAGPGGTGNWKTMRSDLQGIPSELHWLCNLHRDVIRGNDESVRILNKWFYETRIIDQERFSAEIRETALQRGVRWVGTVDFMDRNQVRWVSDQKPQEVWVVRQMNGLPKTFIAETDIQGTVKRYGSYYPGEPLFAPYDKRTTQEIVQGLKKKYRIRNTKAIDWPASWPDNFRY